MSNRNWQTRPPRVRVLRTLAGLLTIVWLASSCVGLQFLPGWMGGGPPPGNAVPQPDDDGRPLFGPGLKGVVAKREPTYLIAGDATECTVSPERFRRVEIGERVFCTWRLPD